MKNNPADSGNALDVVEKIRPVIEPLDLEWSRSVLAQITAEECSIRQPKNVHRVRSSSRVKKWGLTAAVASGAIVVGTGLAVASGIVPSFVTESFGKLEQTSPHFLEIGD